MIFLYRGELHKVSGITRQWLIPKPAISLSVFRQALEKRNVALRSSSLTSGLPTPCLTHQDTCVSGSHSVSPSHVHAREGPRDDPETDIGQEGRGDSDGLVKADYMDEDILEVVEDGEDKSKYGGVIRNGSCKEEGYRDLCATAEDSTARLPSRGQSFDDNELRFDTKLESDELAELEEDMDMKERKKRKREETSLVDERKGKVKVKVKVEDEVLVGGTPVAVEPMVLDTAGAGEEMELDEKVVDKEVGIGDTSEIENIKKEGSDAILGLAAEEHDGQMEVIEDEQGDFVRVEAPSTPPVHSEELNFGKAVVGRDLAEVVREKTDAGGKKAELEAKLEKLTAEKHHLVQMLKQVLSTEKVSKKKVLSASQSPSAQGPSPASQDVPSSTDLPAAPIVQSEIATAGGTEVSHKVDVHSSTQVRSQKFARQPSTARVVQVITNEEESKKKVQNASQSPSAPGPLVTSQAASISAEVPAASIVQSETAVASGAEVQGSTDLEEGELEYARTPSPPPSHTPIASQSASHGTHPSHGPTPALGPLLGRQPQHMNQSGSSRGSYYPQGLGLPSPSSAAAAALAGTISPGTGFMSLVNRPYPHQMAMQHALHAQKVAAAAAAAGHSHMNPILGGGGPAGPGNGVSNGPPGFGGYGVSPSVHGHHGHMPQGASSGAGHISAQQGASPSLLTTPRGPPGYHEMRNLNPPWNLQR